MEVCIDGVLRKVFKELKGENCVCVRGTMEIWNDYHIVTS